MIHNRDLFQWVNGKNASYERWVLGSFSDAEYLDATAGVRSGSDLNQPDTDGDGLIDGSDPDPLNASEAEAR